MISGIYGSAKFLVSSLDAQGAGCQCGFGGGGGTGCYGVPNGPDRRGSWISDIRKGGWFGWVKGACSGGGGLGFGFGGVEAAAGAAWLEGDAGELGGGVEVVAGGAGVVVDAGEAGIEQVEQFAAAGGGDLAAAAGGLGLVGLDEVEFRADGGVDGEDEFAIGEGPADETFGDHL